MSFLAFSSENERITCNGTPVRLKGINWFGMETSVFALHGLWRVSFDSIFQVIKDQDFNALRIPLSVEAVEKMETQAVRDGVNNSINPSWYNLTIAAFLDRVIKRCADAGILVMLDMHLLKAHTKITPLWYDAEYPETRVINAWRAVVARFQRHWNFFACDLKNEPYGATWGDGNMATDWRAAAERIGNAILAVSPRMLIFVEGINGPDSNWGAYMVAAGKAPVRLSNPKRLVYSPHVYGPDVADKPMFQVKEFPRNLPPVWESQWAYLKLDRDTPATGPAVVLGEWGGFAKQGSRDLTWQRAMAEYLQFHDFSAFYWCVNPNSSDTGGILGDDWITPQTTKLELIRAACPAPSSFDGGRVVTPAKPRFSVPWTPQLLGLPPRPPSPPSPDRPVTPGTIKVTSRSNQRWQGEAGEVTQWDVTLKNEGTATVKSHHRFTVKGAEVVNIWNMPLVGPGQYKLPAWLLANGGLQPGAVHTFGLITHKGTPRFSFSVDKNAKRQ